ncbi:MAG: sensor histidine kinase [Rhodocyclales bacterium GT-UBC]|nr:MAG: sensor histidine kinase [Rhodocyclales bacterium GT-UBC]
MKPASLRIQLLRRLLPAMLVLLLAGAATAYWVAWRSATKAYDRALYDTMLAIADQLRVVDGKPLLPLTPQARAVLLTDKFDRVFYAVRGSHQEVLDGEPELPLPPTNAHRVSSGEPRFYYDGVLHGQPVRVAAMQVALESEVLTVLAGETLVKRNALIREIILGMLLPELLLTLVSISVVWFGVRSGLHPLAELRSELAGRSQADLSPVRVDVPEEIQPVVTEINELLRRLERSLSSQRNFVSDAAHQLRTPIAALQAQVEASLNGSTPETRQQLEGVLAAAHRLSHLVAQMLSLARAEPTLSQTQPEVSLEAVVQKVAESWLPFAFSRQIDLGFELAPAFVRGNGLLLEELLANLINNALRHTPRGGTVTVSCGEEAGHAWLCVEDSGPGIAAEERERVFERFYQPAGSLSDGNGLGLAIVREVARQHGGSVVALHSEKLGGALLRVSFPAHRAV